MSTDDQIHSPDRQRTLFHQYCKQWHVEPIAEYTDEGVSAYKIRYFDRPQLARMLADAEKGMFDLVWVEAIDRLARDEADFFIMRRLLEAAGIAIVELGTNPNEKQNALLQGIKALLAANYSREMGTRIANAYAVNVKKGFWPAGEPPTGYQYDPETRHLKVNEETAPFVRRAFELYREKKSVARATVQLHLEGFKSPRGHRVGVSSVSTVLKNPIYRGIFMHKGQPYPMDVPALMEPELLVDVDRILEDQRTRPQRAHLSCMTWAGLLKCEECGRNLNVCGRRGRKNEYSNSYRCNGARSPFHDCRTHVTESILERQILPDICAELRQMTYVEAPTRQSKKPKGPTTEEFEQRRGRVQEMYVEGEISRQRKDELLSKIESAEAELRMAALTAPALRPQLTAKQLEAALHALETSWHSLPSEARRELLQQVISYVSVSHRLQSGYKIHWKS